MIVMYGSFSLAFWYGSEMVRGGEINAGNVVLVFFSVFIAAASLGGAGKVTFPFGLVLSLFLFLFLFLSVLCVSFYVILSTRLSSRPFVCLSFF